MSINEMLKIINIAKLNTRLIKATSGHHLVLHYELMKIYGR